MNKKFSTLVAVGLLASGALLNSVDAKNYTAAEFAGIVKEKVLTLPAEETDLVVNLTENASVEGGYLVINTPGITLTAEVNKTFTGRLVIAAEGVTVKDIKFINTPVNEDANGYWTKNAITAFADKITVTGNTFTQGEVADAAEGMVVSNGLVIFPQIGEKVAYNVSKNTFTANLVASKNGGYTSTGVIISSGATMNVTAKPNDPLKESSLAGYKGTSTAIITDKTFDAKAIAAANTFTECFTDFLCTSVEAKTRAAGDPILVFGQVTYNETLQNAAALADIVTSANATSTVVVKGSSYAVQEALATLPAEIQRAVASSNAAVECDNGFILLGNAELPADTDKGAVEIAIGAPETAFGQKIVASVNSGSYYLLSDGTGNGFVGVNESGVVAASYVSSEAAALWKVQVTKPAGGVYQYTFTNKAYPTVQLELNGTKVFTTSDGGAYNKGGFILKAGDKFVGSSSGAPTAVDAITNAKLFGLYEAGLTAYSAEYLLSKMGAGFDMTIDTEKDAEAAIEGNPFTGILKPVSGVKKVGDNYVAVEFDNSNKASTNFYLQTANGKFIALDKNATWSEKTANLNGKLYNRGYKFVTLTAKEVAQADSKDYLLNFSVKHSAAADNAKEIVLAVNEYKNAAWYEFGQLYVATVKGQNLLTTSASIQESIGEVWPYAIFGGTNMAKQTDLAVGKFITVSQKTGIEHRLDGFTKVLTVVTDVKNNTTAAFVDVDAAVSDTLPAAQWAVKVTGDNGIVLANREFPGVTYSDFSAGLYTIKDRANDFAVASNLKDTVRIKFHDKVSAYDGYQNFDNISVGDNLFKISLNSPILGSAYLTENHGTDHRLGFVKEATEATEWSLAKMTAGRHQEAVTKTDTIYVVSTFSVRKNDEWKTKNDTLKITPFYFINHENGEPIKWGKDAANLNPSGSEKNPEAYICNPATGNLTTIGQAFVMKVNGKGYNLVAVDYNEDAALNNYTWNAYQAAPNTSLESLYKLYAGISSEKGITNRDYSYRKTENDIFNVVPTTANMYRKVAMSDTIKIFREDNGADVLFEKGYKEGNFLGRVNDVQFPKTAPAIYVDTAYVDRAKNNRWEYLLVVNPKRVTTNEECTIPGHPKHAADTTYGRFLVNLIDSANIFYQSEQLHANKFVNSEGFAKLAFVPGYHTHDSLYLDCVKHISDTLALHRSTDAYGVEKAPRSVAKFAFRIMDQATQSFVIETQYKAYKSGATTYAPGYLKWMNDYVVVVPNIKDADVFNMTENYKGAPTSNDQIGTSEVSIIAGNGSVVVKGAAGKSVAISNILGQTIVNTVLTSNNATIAVPAGIVVVAVEGEEAVKTVVK